MKLRLNRRWIRILGITAVLGFLLLNAVSYMHAYRFTHTVPEGRGTEQPEQLSAMGKIKVLFTGVTVAKVANQRTPRDFGLPFEAKQIETSAAGKQFATPVWEVHADGAKRTVLMFHGYHSRREHLLPVAAVYAKNGCNVVLADFPGHGDSQEIWTTLGWREAGVVTALFNWYRAADRQPIMLQGQSLGASAVLRAVSQGHIQPDGLILEEPYGSLLETVRRRFDLMKFPVSFPFAELVVFWGGAQNGFNAFKLNPVEYARDVTAPTLLMGGKRDYRVSPESLEQLHKNLGGRKQIHLFENSGHEALFEDNRLMYESLTLEFLRTCRE